MPGVVDTTHVFATDQVVTSTLMNNIIDQTLFTDQALADGTGTLELVAGRMKVATNGITSNEMGAGAVTATAIAAGVIDNSKISASAAIELSKLAVGALPTAITIASGNIVDGTIVAADIADAAITPAKLNGAQTGSDPIYGIRAFARVAANGTTIRNVGFATISRTGGGTYSLVLTNTPSSEPIITATCHAGSTLNFSANVGINSLTSFTVRTGFEDVQSLSDSPFSIMVIY